jgi:hypothetical protein
LGDSGDSVLSPPDGFEWLDEAMAPSRAIRVVREITRDDLKFIASAPSSESKGAVQTLRAAHHQVARMLSQGRPLAEVSLTTGYSSNYIRRLQDDPTFQELLAHYGAEQDLVLADVWGQMRDLGLDTLAQLRERLENEPKTFSNTQLLEQIKLLLVQPYVATHASAAMQNAQVGAKIEISFVGAKPTPQSDVIDGEIVSERKPER